MRLLITESHKEDVVNYSVDPIIEFGHKQFCQNSMKKERYIFCLLYTYYLTLTYIVSLNNLN